MSAKEFIVRHIEARAIESNIDPKLFLAIAQCESGLQPRVISRTNDKGLFQVNGVHNKTLKQMKLDPLNYIDNVNYAVYLYQKSGTRPWNNSKKCWSALIDV